MWRRIWSFTEGVSRAKTTHPVYRRIEKNKHENHRQENLLTLLILIVFGTTILVKIGGNFWIKKLMRDLGVRVPLDDYSYISHDHPSSWPIELGDTVLMAFSNPKYAYALDTPQGALEWSSLIPSSSSPNAGNTGAVYLGPSKQPFSISMFHQLKCLDIVRNATVRDKGIVFGDEGEEGESRREFALARHCLNYLRQMVMCRGDLELESFQFASNKDPIDLHGVYECKDWSRVYDAVKANQEEYEDWLEKRR